MGQKVHKGGVRGQGNELTLCIFAPISSYLLCRELPSRVHDIYFYVQKDLMYAIDAFLTAATCLLHHHTYNRISKVDSKNIKTCDHVHKMMHVRKY